VIGKGTVAARSAPAHLGIRRLAKRRFLARSASLPRSVEVGHE